MKNVLLCFLAISLFISRNAFGQNHRHEKPVIADAVPNIPEELINGGKLSKYVTLSVPDDDRWNPDNINLNADGEVYVINNGDYYTDSYIGGHFNFIGGIPANGLAHYDDLTGTFTE